MSEVLALCVIALKALTWPELDHWKGLPSNCTLEAVGKVFTVPPGDWRGAGYVGEEPRELSWLTVSGNNFPHSVRVWLDGDLVVLMDAEILGNESNLNMLLRKFGMPALQLDSYFGNAAMPKSEWVYPEMGLTLFVEPDNHNLLRVAVYPATTVEEYRKKFRIVFRPTYR
jgi:hypothetical protein